MRVGREKGNNPKFKTGSEGERRLLGKRCWQLVMKRQKNVWEITEKKKK